MAVKKKKRQITKGRPTVKGSSVILTDASGRPIPKPKRADFNTDQEFFHVYYRWRESVLLQLDKYENENDKLFRNGK
jgi:hypothetical protein